jgi:hypothetical protein
MTDERLSLLEAALRRNRRTTQGNTAPAVSVPALTILDTPVTLSTGTGGSSWTTQSGTWPSSATHVYVSVQQGNGAGNFEVRKSSAATGYAICGAVSANNFSGGTAACAFAKLSGASTFDWRNVANNSYTLTLVGYIS